MILSGVPRGPLPRLTNSENAHCLQDREQFDEPTWLVAEWRVPSRNSAAQDFLEFGDADVSNLAEINELAQRFADAVIE